jgi:hypothetical protein
MSRRRVLVAMALVAAVAAVAWLRHHYSDEARIGRLFRDGARAVAEERLLGVAAKLKRSYTDPWGFSYESLLGTLGDLFSSHEQIDVDHRLESVSVSGDTAVAVLSLSLRATAGGSRQVLLGGDEPVQAVVELERDRGSWLIARTTELSVTRPDAPGQR